MRASLWRRLGAMVYDSMIVVAIWMATIFLLVTISRSEITGFWLQSLLFLEVFFFFLYFWRAEGQTVGMMAWRMRVLSDDGNLISISQATMRFAGAILAIGCFGLGYLWALVDPLGRSWPDLMSGSHIVVEPKQQATKKTG